MSRKEHYPQPRLVSSSREDNIYPYQIDNHDKIKESNHDGGALDMSNFVSKEEFDQFEKRMDDKFNHLNEKIDSLPERIADKMNLTIVNEINKVKDEIQKENKANIKWFIGITVSIGLALLKLFGAF